VSLLLFLVTPSAPDLAGASARQPSPAVVAQAHAAFAKYMSAHAPAISRGHWVSPAINDPAASAARDGSVTSLPSINWSGYADVESSSQTLSAVSGQWTMPAVQCLPRPYQNQDAFLAQWVGLDGVTDSTVEQLGTAAQCFEGVTYYYVWYEMYPSGTVEEGTTACIDDNVNCPRPGDRISASVSVKPGTGGNNNYTLALHDYTRPDESFSVSQECAATTCADSSAEWVVERPAVLVSLGAQILPLADYRNTSFTQATETSGGKTAGIGGFDGGPIYDIPMSDDTGSYYLSCIGQSAPSGTLLSTTPNQCPTAVPGYNGRFSATWDSSF
jgi:hypothetical protein